MKNFILGLIDSFNIGDSSVQISVVTVNIISQIVFDLDDFSDRQTMKQAVKDIVKGPTTFTDTGIYFYISRGTTALVMNLTLTLAHEPEKIKMQTRDMKTW